MKSYMALFQKPTSIFMIFKLSFYKNKLYESVVHSLDIPFSKKNFIKLIVDRYF